MDERTLEVLEFDKIRRLLAEETSFGPGRDAALALEPVTDPAAVERAQRETSEARSLLDRGEGVPLGGLRDIRPFLADARAGALLEPSQLLDIVQTCEGAWRLRGFLRGRAGDCPTLAAAADGIGHFPELVAAIRRCVTDRAEIADSASRRLQQIRSASRAALARVKEKLESIVRSPEHRKALQEPIITLRDDRYVVPVRAEYREALPGVVHDRSASGMTLFVEPLAVVPLNNELRQLALEERDEVARILRELTDTVLRFADELAETVKVLGHIDLCVAKGRLSGRQDAVSPVLGEEGTLDLREARHPLLKVEPPGRVVPVNVRIGQDFDTMVITGPNTGGKTVTLKTVGLLTLMALAGLHVPAAEGTRVSVFRGVWADIGDEQSIEQNLSTFSAHLRNIISIIDHVEKSGGEGQLVLLDEIGAGTDPAEGAALAMALLDYFHRRGARTIATTHYSQIKAFVYERERMVNASVEFDVETLAPTYRLTIGLPGRSNALEISNRLGLPQDIIGKARGFLESTGRDVPALIQKLEEDRARVEAELREARESSRRAREMQEEQARKWAHIRADEERVLAKAREEARRIVRTARLETAALLERIRETERRLAALEALRRQAGAEGVAEAADGADGADGVGGPGADQAPEAPGPAAATPEVLPDVPLESRRRLDRLEQAARDILRLAERRAGSLALPGAGPQPEGDHEADADRRPWPTPGRGAGVTPEPEVVRPGRTFYVAGLRHFGEVLAPPDEGGMVSLMVGSMRLTVHISDLRLPGQAGVPPARPTRRGEAEGAERVKGGRGSGAPEPAAGAGVTLEKALEVSPELHLRGLTVEEALARLDKYLDDAALAGLETVRVVHGRGTGALRQAVRDHLDGCPHVLSHRAAAPSEGGTGVTLVRLRQTEGDGGDGGDSGNSGRSGGPGLGRPEG
ncbi:MAG TPA: endonuclease MutS2 [Clostridiales bacterium]|mgnify:CR=1 FL=1|nr:endonuclease MutS2 [Clostridiales bacterium]